MLNPDRKLQNICVKILATWEGLQACAGLSDQGIMSLATGIVSLQQAALASEVGCAYIGCYVNELRVHFDKS
jgi:transaldolase